MDLLEAFGEFAGDQQVPLAAEAGQQVGDAFLDAMGGLVEHQGAGQGTQIVQGLATGGSPGRQEAEEQPGSLQSGNRHGGGHGAGAGDRHDGHLPGAGGADQPRPGVGNSRSAGIGDVGHAFSGPHVRHDAGGGGGLVVLVQGDQAGMDAMGGKQGLAGAGIFRRDQVDRFEDVQGMRAQVAQVADGGGDDVEGAGKGRLGGVEHGLLAVNLSAV
jgi:hypothetical protein